MKLRHEKTKRLPKKKHYSTPFNKNVIWFASKIVVVTTINGPYMFNSHKPISIIIVIGNLKINLKKKPHI
jgi:hypothetical protein